MKKRTRATRETSDSDEEQPAFLDKLATEETIPVEFEFFQFLEGDYHSINKFLDNYLGGKQYENGLLANELIEQFYVGSVIKVEDEEGDVVGIFTAFNIIKHKNLSPIKSIKEYFLQEIEPTDDEELQLLNSIIDSDTKSVALIISERIESVPVVLAPHLYSQLLAEIASAFKTEQDDGVSAYEYKFDYFLIKVPIFYEITQSKPSKLKKKKVEGKQQDGEPSRFYMKPEEEILEDFAEHIWHSKPKILDASTPNAMDGRGIIKEEFELLLIPSSKMQDLVKALNQNINIKAPSIPAL